MNTKRTLCYLALSALLLNCGSGGGGTASTTPTNSGTNSSSAVTTAAATVTQGTITGFGSVIVNGVHYDVSSASISVDDAAKVESELNVGDTVRISAAPIVNGRAQATKLEGESKLRGQITSIDTNASTIVALGQTILISADTLFKDGASLATLAVGNTIRVSGYTNADNQLVATRVDVLSGTEAKDFMLAGVIADLNTTAMTFTLNGTKVDYSKATINDLPNKTISNGLAVRLHGTYVDNIFVASGNIRVSSMELKHSDDANTSTVVGAGGLITNLVSGTSFSLNNTKVLLQSSTSFENGTIDQLSDGLLVKVRGTLDDDKNLIATKITLLFKPKVDEEGLIQAIDLINNKISLNGVAYEITVDTLFYDRGLGKVRLFSMKDLAVGDYIQVRGYKIDATDTSTQRLIATSVIRKNSNEKSSEGFKAEIKGIITATGVDNFTVKGRAITIDSKTQIKNITNIQSFLSGAVGLDVEVKAIVSGTTLIARTIELNNEDDDQEHHQSSSSKRSSSSSSSKASDSSKSSLSNSVTSTSTSSSSSSAADNAITGKSLYESNSLGCVSCHGAKGTVGTKISTTKTSYGGKSLANYISTQMPPGNLGTCNTQCGIDIAAYIKTW